MSCIQPDNVYIMINPILYLVLQEMLVLTVSVVKQNILMFKKGEEKILKLYHPFPAYIPYVTLLHYSVVGPMEDERILWRVITILRNSTKL